MNKNLKRSMVLALCAGFMFSVIALSACSDKDLISGNFRTEATASQIEEVKGLIAEEKSEKIVGDTSSENWSYNARFVTRGSAGFVVNATADKINEQGVSEGRQTADITADIRYDSDHTLTMYNAEGEVGTRGSGKVDYSTKFAANGLSEEDYNYERAFKGKSYSDLQNFYIDGSVTTNADGVTSTQTGKLCIDFDNAFDQFFPTISDSDTLIDLSLIRELMEEENVKVYIDDSADFKVKVSLDVNAWLKTFAGQITELLNNIANVNITEEQILKDSKFRYADFYLQFDKETKVLLGYGNKMNVDLGIKFDTDDVSADIKYTMNLDSWMVHTDTPAEQLPEDISSYTYILM